MSGLYHSRTTLSKLVQTLLVCEIAFNVEVVSDLRILAWVSVADENFSRLQSISTEIENG